MKYVVEQRENVFDNGADKFGKIKKLSFLQQKEKNYRIHYSI